MANKEEILAGLAEIVNEETGVEVEDVQAGQVLHRGPGHRLHLDDDHRRER